jgi:sigma-B regulation protein RsbU (phosphoserine phosphatase)
MLINRDGAEQVLKLTGPAIGAASDADYDIMEVVMEKGDTLFAYTDGLTDTANAAGEYYGEKGLIPLFAGDQTLSSLLLHIQQQIERHATGARQFDDITMLAVRRLT